MALSPLQDPQLRDVPVVDGYKVLEPAVLVEKLPEGGMAAVYRGLHLDLKVEVAVKVLKKNDSQQYTPQAVARFRQEAEQAARLNDPYLVRIYDFPANRLGLLYLVMEYIDGETLESRVYRKGRLSPREAVTIALFTAKGLAAAHAEKVVHRDIKPPNILISKRGHVKVADLGIAKAQDSAAVGMTQEVTLLGTPQYMAPELWRGARFASAASDVFAVGATLAFMLTGRHLLDGQDVQEIMHKALTEGFPDLAAVAPDVPAPLADVVRATTATRPQDRPTIDTLIATLSGLLASMGGEQPLADPAAGAATQPLSPTRFPSRSDLELIRRRLEQKVVRRDVPATLGMDDQMSTMDPATLDLAQAPRTGTPLPRVVPPTAQPHIPSTSPSIPQQPQPGQQPFAQYPPSDPYDSPARVAPPPMGPGAATTAASVPPSAYRPPKRKKSLIGRLILTGFVLTLVGGGVFVFGLQEGWIKREWIPESIVSQKWLSGLFGGDKPRDPTTQPTTGESTASTAPANSAQQNGTNTVVTLPATKPTGQEPGPAIATTLPATGPAVAQNPKTNPVENGGVPSTQAVVHSGNNPPTTVATTGPATNPAVAVNPPTTRPVDPPTLTPAQQFDAAIAKAKDSTKDRQWTAVLSFVADTAPLAESLKRQPEYLAAADTALMAMRADVADLSVRRDAFPQLLTRLLPAVKAGSGPAALAVAEQYLNIKPDAPAGSRLTSTDPEGGYARAARYLDQAARSDHPQAKAEARGYLREAIRKQVEYLGGKRDWSALMDWLAGVPVADALRSTEEAERAAAAGWVTAADTQLTSLIGDVTDPAARRRLVPADGVARLSPFADSGSSAAALLLAESGLTLQGEGDDRHAVVAGNARAEQIESWLSRAQSAGDAKVKSIAFNWLVDQRAGQVATAVAARQWQQAIDALLTSRPLLTDPLATPAQQTAWQNRATKTILAFRADQKDLDRRRTGFPRLETPARQLADAGVKAASLLLAERTLGYEGNPPRAVGLPGDPDLRFALTEVQNLLRLPDCPPAVKESAQDLEYDMFASFAWRAAAEKPPQPQTIADKLASLSDCGAIARREADFTALVDKLLPANDSASADGRVRLAEHRLKVVEDQFGHRLISQKSEIANGPIRQMLMPARDAVDARVRGRANGLLGDIAQQKGDLLAAFVFYTRGIEVAQPTDQPDPVSLMGLAWFYQLEAARLNGPDFQDASFQPLRAMTPGARALKAQGLYRMAANSGDPFARFMYAEFTNQMYQVLNRPLPTEVRQDIESQLERAIRAKHVRAAAFLKLVRGER